MAEDPPPEAEDTFGGNYYTGARLGLRINTLDDMQFPENGIDWHSTVSYVYQLDGPNRRFTDVHSRIAGYYTFSAGIPFTLVGRVGAGINTGDYAFYQSQTLGAGTGYNRGGSIRGYARDRFRGFGTFYQNIELRAQLVRIPVFQEYVVVGISGFFDNGRVFSDTNDASKWHNAAGAGIFVRPNGMTTLEISYASSEEEQAVAGNVRDVPQ